MKIVVTEEQLKNIDDSLGEGVLFEGLFNVKYKCAGEFSDAVEMALETEKIRPVFVRTALAILGRESNYGAFRKEGSLLPSRYALKAGPEYVLNLLSKNEKMKGILDDVVRKLKKKENWVPSMGIAQMTPDIAERYGVNLNELMSKTGSLIAAASYLRDIYVQLRHYDENKPSVILHKGRFITNPSSTGNARLDATIISYNLGSSKLRKRFCVTNDSNLLGPCNSPQYKPYPNSKPDMVLTVDQTKWIKNYIPNYETSKITSHGYLKEVSQRIKIFTCV